MAKVTIDVPEELLGDIYVAVGEVLQRAQAEEEEEEEQSGDDEQDGV